MTSGEWLKARMYVTPNLGQLLPGIHENTHLVVLPLLPQGKGRSMNFPQRGYTCVATPRRYTCAVPPGMFPLLPQGMLFPPQGINVLPLPLGLCLWLNRPHKKPSKHQSFTFSCFCYRKKNCYPPPTSVTCVLPRERKVLSTAKRNRKQSVLCYLHVHVCNIFMMVLALLEEHHVFVERCCCATTWYVRRAHAQDKSCLLYTSPSPRD